MTYSVNFSNYTIGEESYREIDRVCSPYGSKVVLIIGDHGYYQAKSELHKALDQSSLNIAGVLHFGAVCSFENLEKLKEEEGVKNSHMIFAIGGGKVIDTGKSLGHLLGKPVFTFPTIASNCGACTSVSIMYKPDGSFLKPEFLNEAPKHTFINTKILVEAPVRYLWAGLGDTYAKYYEAQISSRGEELNHPLTMGVHISKQCSEAILKHGLGALKANERKKLNQDFEQTILAIIVTTAWVSILLTLDHSPDYNSGLAHAIFYTLTSIEGFDSEKHLHGEIVAFGVLILLLVDGQKEEFNRIYDFNCKTGLPHSLEEMGLNRKMLGLYMKNITEMSDVKHNPYIITEDMLNDAFDKLDHINNKTKKEKDGK